MATKGRNHFGVAQILGVIVVLTVASFHSAAQTLPTISSLSPSSVVAGSQGFTLTVNGDGFASGSTVQWGGMALSTAFLGATQQLFADVSAGLITTAGTVYVSVTNPGGAASPPAPFTILPSSPTINNLSPSSAVAGSQGFTLTINGNGFASGSAVEWGGTALSTAFLSATQLFADVSAGLITTAGTVNVTVMNPGGATSLPVPFTILPSSPTINSLSPSSAVAGSQGFTLNINGNGFVSGSTKVD